MNSLGVSRVALGEESACQCRRRRRHRRCRLHPRSGRSSGEWNCFPLQDSCLENSMGRGAWWATVLGVKRVGHNWETENTHTDSSWKHIGLWSIVLFSSFQFSHSVVSNSLRPHESQHARPPCPSPTPRVYSNPCPLSRWCHPTISSSVIPFSSCSQSFTASGSFPMSQLFAWGGQSIGVSASTSDLPMNT